MTAFPLKKDTSLSLAQVIHRKLLLGMTMLTLFSLVFLGTYFFINEKSRFEHQNLQLSRTLAKYVENYLQEALITLNHAGVGIESAKSQPEIDEALRRLAQADPRFARILYIGPDNTVEASVPTGQTSIDFPVPMQQVSKDWKIMGRPLPLEDGRRMVVFLGHPLENGYTLVAAMELNALQEYIATLKPDSADTILLTDAWGTVLAHPDATAVHQQHNIGDLPFYKDSSSSSTATPVVINGESMFATATRVPLTRWVILATISEKSITVAAMRRVAMSLLLLILLYIGFTLLILLELRTKVTLPVTRLTGAMQRIAGGEYTNIDPPEGSFIELQETRESFLTMIRQVEERERDLSKTRSHMQSIIDAMPSAVIALDHELHLTHMNDAAVKRVGIQREEAIGKPLSLVMPALLTYLDSLLKTLKTQQYTAHEKQILTSEKDNGSGHNAETVFEDVFFYPMRNPDGTSGVTIRIDNVTNRVRMEQVMVQTEKMISVGGLAAGMAHEINNPLGAILQGAQNIERRLMPTLEPNMEAAAEAGCTLEQIHTYMDKRQILTFLEGIRQAGSRAAHIVENMLDFSRRGDVNGRSSINIHTALDKTIELASSDYDLKKKYDFRSLIIEKNYGENIPQIIGVRQEIEQVLLNLLRNAAQAIELRTSPKEKGKITISTNRSGNNVRIAISDNGIGMDEATRKRVFEPFFTTKDVGVGTGLGLSVSYFIIKDNHDGDIEVVSAPYKGTTFIIELPSNGA